MNYQFLDFEQPIAELRAKIEELRLVADDGEVNLTDEIIRLEKKCSDLTSRIFSKLSSWQVTQLARHPMRPHVQDYVDHLLTEFDELHGDRHYSAAPEILGGIGLLDKSPVMVLGHQKGRTTQEKIQRNFGMSRPEGYRKALRLMKMAEKFSMPVITFIDSAGAYPGIGAEERNQSEAIARNLLEMASLKTPIVCLISGEGGSGGALAIGMGDRVLMLEYSIYSVISPEGCASILWKDAGKASDAAEALGITAQKLKGFGLIDDVIEEPSGGAHRDVAVHMTRVKDALVRTLNELKQYSLDELVQLRQQKFMDYGRS